MRRKDLFYNLLWLYYHRMDRGYAVDVAVGSLVEALAGHEVNGSRVNTNAGSRRRNAVTFDLARCAVWRLAHRETCEPKMIEALRKLAPDLVEVLERRASV